MSERTEYRNGEFCWIDLMAHDMEGAADFYPKLFGWSCNRMDTEGGPPYAQFELDGKSVCGLGQMPDDMKSQGIPPIWSSYINVDDIEATLAKVTELGGQITMPLMKVLEAGHMAFIQDPSGGNVALWQKGYHFGAQSVNDTGCWCWNELATRDAAKAKDFFAQLFGWEYEAAPDSPSEYYMIKCQGRDAGGIIVMDEKWGDMPPAWTVYFTVDDADACCAKMEQLGGKVIMPAFDIGVGRMAVIADPQGAAFSIIKMNCEPE